MSIDASRRNLSHNMGIETYGGKRNVEEALGYPPDTDLTYDYYLKKYDRQDIASAVVDKPVDKTWNGDLVIIEPETKPDESKLLKEWNKLNKEFKVKKILRKADKLSSIGSFSVILFGFSDVSTVEDFSNPAGGKLKLQYLKAYSEGEVTVSHWELNTKHERYGLPLIYSIVSTNAGATTQTTTLEVHWSRILHINNESMSSEIYGRPVMKPIMNRLLDIEKVLGGDAEMFWRGARPGYTATAKEDYSVGEKEILEMEEEMDKYEHDLRRFVTSQGIDIKALEQQVADPLNHLDAQIQAISAQTNIPKRILVGSERGELSSSQDKGEWLSVVQDRQEEYAEPTIVTPFVDKCMEFGVLTYVEEYNVMWMDLFAPSEKEKVEVGAQRADALSKYSNGMGSEIVPPELAAKYLLGLTEEQVEEVETAREAYAIEEDKLMEEAEEEQRRIDEEAAKQLASQGGEEPEPSKVPTKPLTKKKLTRGK
jgi:hypothetical protein